MKIIKIIFFLICITFTIESKRPTIQTIIKNSHKYKKYPLSIEPIDVIIVCHPKDMLTLDLAINGIKENGNNIRRVIVISAEKLSDIAK